MANPKVGQSATLNGKKVVWSGQNYGWQSPASHKRLANDGKFKHGTQALDRVASSAKNFVKDKLPGVAKAATNYKNWSDESARRVAARDAKTTVGKGINAVKAVTNAPARAKDAAVQAVSNKTNVDPRIVRAGAEVVGAVVKTKAGQGITKASGGRVAPPTNRSVGAAAKADVAGRTAPATRRLPTPQKDGVVKPSTSRTQATKASSSPGIAQRTTPQQASSNATRTAASQPATRFQSPGRQPTSGATTAPKSQVVKDASGPIKPKTDGRAIPRGNTVEKAQPTNREKTRQLKETAQSQYVRQEQYGNNPAINKPAAGKDTRNYLPDNGRRSPTAPTIADQKAAYKAKLVKERIPAEVRGQARRTAERAIDKEVTQYGKSLEQKARERVTTYQANQQAKSQKGSTASSRESMATDMAGRPKAPIKPTRTQTTGTNRIPSNPSTPKRNHVASTEHLSPTERAQVRARMQRGSNPANSFSSSTMERTAAARRTNEAAKNKPSVSTQSKATQLNQRGRIIEDDKSLRTGLRGDQLDRGQGRRGTGKSAAGSEYKSEEYQVINGKKVGRLGRPVAPGNSSSVRNPTVTNRQAAAKAAKDLGRSTNSSAGNKPSRTAKAEASRASTRTNTAQSRASRQQTRGLSKEERNALQKAYDNRVYEDLKPSDRAGNTYQVTRSGEVRLQGTTKGGRYQTGTESGTPDGRVPRVGPHDGSPSRAVANKAQQARERAGRSAEAAKKAAETRAAVRKRAAVKRRAAEVLSNKQAKLQPGVKKTIKNGKPANTIKAKNRAVDRKGNNLNEISLNNLKALGWR
jgi:hypothetical protein